MIETFTTHNGNHSEQNQQKSSREDCNQSTYYTDCSRLPCIVVQPSRKRLTAVNKLYNLMFKVLFFTIAVVALLVGYLVHAVSANQNHY